MQDGPLFKTREELLAAYAPIEDAIKTVLLGTRRSCGATDLKSAADRMGVLAGGKILLRDNDWTYAMLGDLALFEANDRGIRPFDRFLAGPARTLAEHERVIAQRMGDAFFSLFRFTARHEIGGIWVEDLLNNQRRIWIMDMMLENREVAPETFGIRIFDAGQFHASPGVVAVASDRLVRLCIEAQSATGTLPFRRSLAAIVYGLNVMDGRPTHLSGLKFAHELLPLLKDLEAKPLE